MFKLGFFKDPSWDLFYMKIIPAHGADIAVGHEFNTNVTNADDSAYSVTQEVSVSIYAKLTNQQTTKLIDVNQDMTHILVSSGPGPL
jgi:hypothetical protein